jgi:hypothetical protein
VLDAWEFAEIALTKRTTSKCPNHKRYPFLTIIKIMTIYFINFVINLSARPFL